MNINFIINVDPLYRFDNFRGVVQKQVAFDVSFSSSSIWKDFRICADHYWICKNKILRISYGFEKRNNK